MLLLGLPLLSMYYFYLSLFINVSIRYYEVYTIQELSLVGDV